MRITIPYAIRVTKKEGIRQNYQSLREAYDKRNFKKPILNACLYLLINRDYGMSSLQLSI